MGRRFVVGLVVGYDLVDLGIEFVNLSVYGRRIYIVVVGVLGDSVSKYLYIFFLVDKRVSLEVG